MSNLFKGYATVLYVSPLNRRMIEGPVKQVFIDAYPDMKEQRISHDKLITSLIRFYLGEEYDRIRSDVIEREKTKGFRR